MPTILDLLPGGQPLTVGDADVAGPLAVFPVFGPAPRLEYLSFAEAAATQGAALRELPSGASVNDVLVVNPGPRPVLLYEGEELIGAQQNRTVDAAVLVAAGATVQVPVTCVEHGRWDGSRHADAFQASPQAAYPALRAAKSRAMHRSIAAGGAARADQGEVWNEVARKVASHGTRSGTGAMSDVFDQSRGDAAPIAAAVERRDGQTGAVVAINGRLALLDHVSRADVFAVLHGPLVAGYALDALEQANAAADRRETRPVKAAPSRLEAEEFLARVLEGTAEPHARAGAGIGLTVTGRRCAGLALAAPGGGELLQLSAYTA